MSTTMRERRLLRFYEATLHREAEHIRAFLEHQHEETPPEIRRSREYYDRLAAVAEEKGVPVLLVLHGDDLLRWDVRPLNESARAVLPARRTFSTDAWREFLCRIWEHPRPDRPIPVEPPGPGPCSTKVMISEEFAKKLRGEM